MSAPGTPAGQAISAVPAALAASTGTGGPPGAAGPPVPARPYPAYPLGVPEPDYALPNGPFPGAPAGIGRHRGPDRRGRRLAVAALAIALSSALVGGILGGWVATRSRGDGTTPGYSLGLVPPGLTNRPAASIAGIAARVLPSVVMVRVNGGAGTGSGFVIHGGYIVTNNHVITLDGHVSHPSIQIFFRNGTSVPGRLVGRDTYSDIAVLRAVGVARLPALTLGNSGGLDVGDPVIAFGAPLGLAGTVTSGIVSALDRPVQPGADNGPAAPQVYLEAIQTDAPINPGNSGGPLVNGHGQVIGVNAAFDTLGGSVITGQSGSIGLGFAIPINQVRRVATQIIRTGHATHSIIGALLSTSYDGAGAQIAEAPDSTAPGSTAPGSTAPDSTAPDSTAPDSPAPDSPGRASPAPDSASPTPPGSPGTRSPSGPLGRSDSARSPADRPDAARPDGTGAPRPGRTGDRSESVAAPAASGDAIPPVTPGGPASAAGLRPGDVIISFGGQLVTNAQTLLDAIRADPPGARVRLIFLRGGHRHTVVVRLGSAPS